jgi:hypothetical protein
MTPPDIYQDKKGDVWERKITRGPRGILIMTDNLSSADRFFSGNETDQRLNSAAESLGITVKELKERLNEGETVHYELIEDSPSDNS